MPPTYTWKTDMRSLLGNGIPPTGGRIPDDIPAYVRHYIQQYQSHNGHLPSAWNVRQWHVHTHGTDMNTTKAQRAIAAAGGLQREEGN